MRPTPRQCFLLCFARRIPAGSTRRYTSFWRVSPYGTSTFIRPSQSYRDPTERGASVRELQKLVDLGWVMKRRSTDECVIDTSSGQRTYGYRVFITVAGARALHEAGVRTIR